MSEAKTYQGSCHCGAVRYEVTTTHQGAGPDGSEMYAINVRCLEGVDADALPAQKYDGASA